MFVLCSHTRVRFLQFLAVQFTCSGVRQPRICPFYGILFTLLGGRPSYLLKLWTRPESVILASIYSLYEKTHIDSITWFPVYTQNRITLISKPINNEKKVCVMYTLIFLSNSETCREFVATSTSGYLDVEFALETRFEVPYSAAGLTTLLHH
jgi:hypothetical protein